MNKKVIQSLSNYPRDMTGYGKESIHPNWPNNAKIAVQFVLNYEEGGENSILHGDDASETFLSEIIIVPECFQRLQRKALKSDNF